jgi:hypothetical protein
MNMFFYGCEDWSLTLRVEHRLRMFENTVLRRLFGPKKGWKNLRVEDVAQWGASYFALIPKYHQAYKIKENEAGGACGTHGRGEKSVHGLGGKARRKETTRKTEDGRLWSKWILGRLGGGLSAFAWLRLGTGGGLLWTWWWNFRFWLHGFGCCWTFIFNSRNSKIVITLCLGLLFCYFFLFCIHLQW